MQMYSFMVDDDALLLREATGTSAVVETARAVVSSLAHYEIAHLIVGGLAVQQHGYPRVTIDVDIVVPDVLEAVEFGTADLSSTLVPRSLVVDPAVRGAYLEIWDGLQAEK